MQGLATVLRLPIVAATVEPHCRIYDRMGETLAHQGVDFDFAMADVLIDEPLFHLDFQGEKLEAIRRERKDVSAIHANGNAVWRLAGRDDPQFLQELIRRYDLMDVDDYLRRAEKRQEEARE